MSLCHCALEKQRKIDWRQYESSGSRHDACVTVCVLYVLCCTGRLWGSVTHFNKFYLQLNTKWVRWMQKRRRRWKERKERNHLSWSGSILKLFLFFTPFSGVGYSFTPLPIHLNMYKWISGDIFSYIFTFALSCMGGNGGSLVILPSFHENRIELNTTHRRRECREQSESRNFKYRASVKVKECVCAVLQHLRRFVTSVEREIIKIHSYRAECLLF